MKKLLLTASILSLTSFGFSAYALEALDTLNGGGTKLDTSDIAGTYSKIVITDDDVLVRNSGNSTTGTITVQKSTIFDSFNPNAANAYIVAEASYQFNGPVVLDCDATSGSRNMSVNVNNGATLEFTQGLTVNSAGGRTRLRFGTDGAEENSQYMANDKTANGNVILNAVTGTIATSGSSVTTPQLLIAAVNLTVKNTNTETNKNPVYLGSYTMLMYNAELNLQVDADLGILNPRSSRNPSAGVGNLAGTVKLNGHTLTVDSINMNVESSLLHGDLVIDMNGKDSQFICDGNVSFDNTYNFQDYHLDFINYTSDDKILFKNKLSNTVLSKMSINGLSGDNIKFIQEGDYWSYSVTVVPEPSTYALIFGALALGFVAYRRRK